MVGILRNLGGVRIGVWFSKGVMAMPAVKELTADQTCHLEAFTSAPSSNSLRPILVMRRIVGTALKELICCPSEWTLRTRNVCERNGKRVKKRLTFDSVAVCFGFGYCQGL